MNIAVDPSPASERPSAFRNFVEEAAAGRNGLWRILAGVLVVVAITAAGTVALFAAGTFAIAYGFPAPPYGPDSVGDNVFGAFMSSRAGLATAVLSLGLIWPGVWIALRLFHGRPLGSVLGAGRRLRWDDFSRAMTATLVVALLAAGLSLMSDPTTGRGDLPLTAWALALPVLVAILLIQTSAEEVLFRGYLLQALAQRFRSPFVWAVVPAVLFGVLHWQPGALGWMNLLVIALIAVFAAAATFLVWYSGNLGAAMGMHFANNVVALLFVSSDSAAESLSLFSGRAISDPGWTLAEAAVLAIAQVASSGAVVAMLTVKGSPLRLTPRMHEPAFPTGSAGRRPDWE